MEVFTEAGANQDKRDYFAQVMLLIFFAFTFTYALKEWKSIESNYIFPFLLPLLFYSVANLDGSGQVLLLIGLA